MKLIERVLVVDRSDLIRQTVGRVLRPRGVAVAEANSLAAAWEYLEADRFQLLLLGETLPDGLSTTLIRELAARMETPYIVSILDKDNSESRSLCVQSRKGISANSLIGRASFYRQECRQGGPEALLQSLFSQLRFPQGKSSGVSLPEPYLRACRSWGVLRLPSIFGNTSAGSLLPKPRYSSKARVDQVRNSLRALFISKAHVQLVPS